MKASREIAERMREMLQRDKMGIKEGFVTALNGDLNRTLNDYFDLNDKCKLTIDSDDNGGYTLSLTATANRIKSFESTADIKRR